MVKILPNIKKELEKISEELGIDIEIVEKKFLKILEEYDYAISQDAALKILKQRLNIKEMLISNLIPNIYATITGKVIFKSEILESKNKKKYGYIVLKDKSTIKVYFWEEKLKDFEKIKKGDKIKINIKTTKGKYSLISNYVDGLEILEREEQKEYKREFIENLKEGYYEIEGLILKTKKNEFYLLDVSEGVWVKYNNIVNVGDYIIVKGYFDGNKFLADKIYYPDFKSLIIKKLKNVSEGN